MIVGKHKGFRKPIPDPRYTSEADLLAMLDGIRGARDVAEAEMLADADAALEGGMVTPCVEIGG